MQTDVLIVQFVDGVNVDKTIQELEIENRVLRQQLKESNESMQDMMRTIECLEEKVKKCKKQGS
jgi:hypothetical protein